MAAKLEDALIEALQSKHVSGRFFEDPLNAVWAVFNAFRGIRHGRYNAGDNVEGACHNNLLHGFDSVDAFVAHCKSIGAPKSAIDFILGTGTKKESEWNKFDDMELKNVMDDVIRWTALEEDVEARPAFNVISHEEEYDAQGVRTKKRQGTKRQRISRSDRELMAANRAAAKGKF